MDPAPWLCSMLSTGTIVSRGLGATEAHTNAYGMPCRDMHWPAAVIPEGDARVKLQSSLIEQGEECSHNCVGTYFIDRFRSLTPR